VTAAGAPAAPIPAEPLAVSVNVRNLTGPHTGIEIYMLELLRALAATGQVRIDALSWAPVGLGLPNVTETVPAPRPSWRPGTIPAALWKTWFDHYGVLRQSTRGPDRLFHGMDGFLPLGLGRRDRGIVTMHDLGWQVHPELYSARLRLQYRALFPLVVRRADHFIAVSRYTADDLTRRAGVPASRIDVIYHGLDPAFAPDPAAPAKESEPYLLAVGGVSPRKNTRRLIEAFVRWRRRGSGAGHRLLITGTSLDYDFVRQGALPDGVSLLGYVDKAELRRLYAGAAAFVYPGIYEGFGLPIVEAMACGAPVVTSTTGAAPEIAGGAALLVDPFDPASIEAGIDRAVQPGTAAELRAQGLVRARAFRWADAAAATVDVYRRVRG
jgi:glycosyltransferase involved in cell wall biosynthesis